MMSVIVYSRKKKQRYPRKRSGKILHRKRVKRNIYKSRGWKLNYPEYFEEIPEYPYIVRKKSNES